jgi:hypothetical protein
MSQNPTSLSDSIPPLMSRLTVLSLPSEVALGTHADDELRAGVAVGACGWRSAAASPPSRGMYAS